MSGLTPYFNNGAGIVIYHGDARDVLPTLTPRCADLLLTDPPYGVNWESGHRSQSFGLIRGDESLDVAREVIALALDYLRHHRHLYVFGRLAFDGLPVSKPVELIWDKGAHSGGDLTVPWASAHEYIQFAVRQYLGEAHERGDSNLATRLRRGTVLTAARISGVAVTRHPTEKPVPLLRELIESSSRFGETVLDPFMGSGSTLVAAQLEGRRCIGIEIEERYCEVAAKRLIQLVLPLEPAS